MPISGSLRILVYHCVYREQLLLTFSIQINLIFYKKMLLMSFFPTPASSWWDLPTPLSLSSFRSFSVLFHLSNGDVAVDPQEIPLEQKQTQKKGKQNKTKVDTKKENRSQRRDSFSSTPNICWKVVCATTFVLLMFQQGQRRTQKGTL